MQGNSLNFIPWNKSPKSKLLLKGDIIDALFCDSITSSDETQAHWRKKRMAEYQRLLNAEEWATNIYADPNLSQSYGNPDYYPEVPQYTPPNGVSYTQKQIQMKIRQNLKNDAFIQNNVYLFNIPVQIDIMNKEYDNLLDIDPQLLSQTVFHGRDIETNTDYYQTTKASHPTIVSHVGYLVSMITNPEDKSTHLGILYVYNKPATIRLLLGFLKDVQVKNMKDLQVVQCYLSSLLPK